MFGLGPIELTLLAIILLLLFGAKRIRLLLGSIGHGVREFRNSYRSDETPPERLSKPSDPDS